MTLNIKFTAVGGRVGLLQLKHWQGKRIHYKYCASQTGDQGPGEWGEGIKDQEERSGHSHHGKQILQYLYYIHILICLLAI